MQLQYGPVSIGVDAVKETLFENQRLTIGYPQLPRLMMLPVNIAPHCLDLLFDQGIERP